MARPRQIKGTQMSKKISKNTLLASTVIAGLTVFSTPAFAQNTLPDRNDPPATTTMQGPPGTPGVARPADEENPPDGIQSQESAGNAEETSQGDIVVTGTLIKNPNLVSSSPVTAVGQEEINLRQSNTAEQILRDIPGTVPSIGQAVNNGATGSAFVDLRGLGSNRNIVLLDGTRIVPADLLGRVDLNIIPLALVERLDVLTGGASTTYGADAISGVVNFITRRDFAGMELIGSQQITERGDGNNFRADLVVGANFDDGRGNAVLSVGYQESDAVFQGDRRFSEFSIGSFSGNIGGSNLATAPTRFGSLGSLGARQVNAEGNAIGAPFLAFNFNPYNVFQTPFERFNIYGAGHYEVSEGLEVYTQALFSKNTINQIIAPTGTFGTSFQIPFANPFITPAQRATICGAFGMTAAQCAAPGATFTTPVNRRFVESGPRRSEYTTTLFNYRAGFRGAITDTINFDVFGSYGESTVAERSTGTALKSRVQQALLATNPNTCLTPTNGCVPLNLFGPIGAITPAQVNFFSVATSESDNTTLAQARAVINGDVGYASPFAVEPIGFAVGGEYRKYGATQRSDLLSQTPGEVLGSGAATPDSQGGYQVYEAFGELIAPLVEDAPFFHSLTLEAGVRQSRYTVFSDPENEFETTTYKVGGSWEPVPSLKIRGNYNRAVRAPNINELFSPVVTGLTNLANDPCAGAAPVGNAALRAVCLAQGAPASRIGLIGNPAEAAAGQVNQTGGGNPNVGPEKANTYTVGFVFQPDFFNGFTLTADYYNIKVRDAISFPTPGDVINACFANITAASATDPACTGIRRNPITGEIFGDPALTPGLPQPFSNLGRIFTDGVDVTANYRTDLPFADARLNLSFNGNYTRNSQFQATPTSVNRECTGFYSVNCLSIQPKYSFNQRTTLSFGEIDVSLLWRYIHKVRQEPLDISDPNGNGPAYQGPLPKTQSALPGAPAPGTFGTVDFQRVEAYNYFDLSTRFGVTENFDMTVTVMNLLDKAPPILGNDIGNTAFNSGNTYPSTYDALGRRFAVGARLKF